MQATSPTRNNVLISLIIPSDHELFLKQPSPERGKSESEHIQHIIVSAENREEAGSEVAKVLAGSAVNRICDERSNIGEVGMGVKVEKERS